MDNIKKQNILSRIYTGISYLSIDNQPYKLVAPTKDDLALSELVFNEVLSNTRFDNLITEKQASNYLRVKNIWIDKDEEALKKNQEYLENLKISLYKALYNTKEKKILRRRIKVAKNSISKLLNRKHCLDHMTLENFAQSIRSDFLTAICIENCKGDKIYDYFNFWQSDCYILNHFNNYLSKNIVSPEEFREISRTEPFRSSWSIGKESIFGNSSSELTENQKTIILYSRMYDNVYESSERPDEEVINDDDMLDGWFADARKQADIERKKKEADKILDKNGGGSGGELFVMADNSLEANRVRGLNTLDSQIKLRSRKEALKPGRGIEEQNLPDVKIELQQEAMRQMGQRRGK